MRAWRGATGLIAGVAIAIGGAGCSAGPNGHAASAAAVQFVRALEDQHGAAACGLLTPDARSSVSGATDVPCEKAILSIDERGADVATVQVWGDAAQVHVAGDVIFLRRSAGDWRISAAGCIAEPSGPYDCDVSA